MARLLAERGVVLSPTLTYFHGHGPGSRQPTPAARQAFENMLHFTALCHESGVAITVGSHMMLTVEPNGRAYQREMEFLVQCGLSPMEAIVAATSVGAHYLRAEARLGSIEPGKLADLILIDGDPLRDIRAMRNIRRVMLGGNWIEPDASGTPEPESLSGAQSRAKCARFKSETRTSKSEKNSNEPGPKISNFPAGSWVRLRRVGM
jgi:imidazolonepropionase-like amidohydrolase